MTQSLMMMMVYHRKRKGLVIFSTGQPDQAPVVLNYYTSPFLCISVVRIMYISGSTLPDVNHSGRVGKFCHRYLSVCLAPLIPS